MAMRLGLLLMLFAFLAASASAQYTIDAGDACIDNCPQSNIYTSDKVMEGKPVVERRLLKR